MGNTSDWPLVRFIAPVFPEVNIFSRYASKMASFGLIMVVTVASKVWGWRVEVIDENNYRGPRDKRGLPDHHALQRENPASVVGFYCGLTSTMERVFELAEFYKKQGAITLAGGWHAHYCPEEALKHDLDVVVHGDGETVIRQILNALTGTGHIADIPGISFLESGQIRTNTPTMLEVSNLDELPYPDFGLLRYARKTVSYYPIGRIRGCGMNCEFCSVKGKPRWATAQHLFNIVNCLVETRKARYFFLVDDRLEQDVQGTIEFFHLVARKYGNRLRFTVQIRLEAAKNTELLEAMKAAGVATVCVGYESPIDEDLKTMRKGYLSSHMIEWTRILRRYFWVHGMFIFGYPAKEGERGIRIGAQETARRFKRFISQAKIDSIQVMHAVPLVGTDLRARLEKQGRIFPLELVPWSKYDGNYVCFMPDDMTLAEFQETPLRIMKWFYSPFSFLKIPLRTIAFPLDFLIRGWHRWRRGWWRDIVNYAGHLLIRRWYRKQRVDTFVTTLQQYQNRR
jgi:radical SAM superfamily enzyme YgiQ (UPF0313 family)